MEGTFESQLKKATNEQVISGGETPATTGAFQTLAERTYIRVSN